jgi:hypothetical protein
VANSAKAGAATPQPQSNHEAPSLGHAAPVDSPPEPEPGAETEAELLERSRRPTIPGMPALVTET